MPEHPTELSSSKVSQRTSQGKLLPLILGFASVILFVICSALSWGAQNFWPAVSIVALFSLPIIAQVIGSCILWDRINSKDGNILYYRWNLLATSVCILSYCSLWIVYSKQFFSNSPNALQSLSLFALALIGILLFFVGVMTAAFIMARSKSKPTKWLAIRCQSLRAGIRDEPLWAVALFFILFLGVAYLFGFALAFHDQFALTVDNGKDQQLRRPALRMANLKSIDDDSNDVGLQSDTADKSVPDVESIFCFYFRDGEAHLRTKPYNRCNPSFPPERTDNNIRKPEEFNDCSLRALTKSINDSTVDGTQVRVFLTGHTSDTPVERSKAALSFLSNYELSEARANNVKYETLRKFPEKERWHNVEWSILPASNEPLLQVARGLMRGELFRGSPKELSRRFGNREIETITASDIEKNFSPEEISKQLVPEEHRVVIATIKPVQDHVASLQMELIRRSKSESHFKPLRLMDYMYFSIYTITTTGYGDIVPTTAYAKFVTSLANICEVLFLVVFFNALISIKNDNNDDEVARVLGIAEDQIRRQETVNRGSGPLKKGDFGRKGFSDKR